MRRPRTKRAIMFVSIGCIQAENEPTHQPEIKKIPFPFDHYRKSEKQNQTEQPQQKGVAADKKSVIEQTKAEQESVSAETKQPETERPLQPKSSVLTAKYPRLIQRRQA